MGDALEKCFWELFFSRFSVRFGGSGGAGFRWFSMVFSGFGGWVSDRTNGGGSVGRSVSQSASQLVRLVRCPLGQAPVRQSASQPASQPAIQKKAWSDSASSVWELSLAWRR